MIFLVFLILMLIYAVTIAQLIFGFEKVRPFSAEKSTPKTFFSIVIPFRNEAQNLPDLLESFRNLDYPLDLFELILIDDFSEDSSVRIVYDWRMANGSYQVTWLENIKISGSPKKDAISRAIPIVKSEWIVTTDADCIVNKNWLLNLDAFIKNEKVSMVAGSVSYLNPKSFLHHFQQLDLTSLQGATIGSFGMNLGFMCNGANFAYTKSLFQELGGFGGNNNVASGDDVFLLQKAVAKFPDKVKYLKSAENIVFTKPENSWKTLFHQRIRWASKTGSYQSVFGKDLAVIVFTANLLCLLAFAFCFAPFGFASGSLFADFSLLHFGILFAIKFMVDAVLLYKTNQFLTGKRLRFLVLGSLMYPFFCVAVALYAVLGTYEWKGRKFKI